MKLTSSAVATALIETCKSLTESDYVEACDAAISLMAANGLGSELRVFPRAVAEALRREEKMISAHLHTPSGDTDGMELALIMALQSALGGTVELVTEKDPSLLGGALLQVGDERFDASISGALDRMKRHLVTSGSLA
jgi:F-type H+-transporting ATPase subunit delta